MSGGMGSMSGMSMNGGNMGGINPAALTASSTGAGTFSFSMTQPFFALHTGFEISKLIELERRTDSSIESSLFSPPYPLVVYLVHSYIQFLFDKRAASKRCFTLTIEVPLFIFFYHSFDVTSLHFSSSSK